MNNKKYLERFCDRELQLELQAIGAVLIEGPKWCGKTSTAQQASNSAIFLQDPDQSVSYLSLADTKPSLLLKGATPRLIDEWQMAPVLWDAVRFEVDKRKQQGQFILTGSASPSSQLVAHTGTGRIARIKMRPMSLFESKESNGSISLGALFSGMSNGYEALSDLSIEQISFIICRGGWPASIHLKGKAALRLANAYVESVIHHDISEVDSIEKNPERVRLLMRSLARNISTTANYSTIIEDIEATESTISDKTVALYISALKRIFVVEDLPAWQPSLRSKTAIRTSDKRHFVDPSIATAIMRIDDDGLLNDFAYFGFLFESLCTRDLRIYAQANDGDVFHYRDKSGLESDLIVRLRNGKWAAIEVKLGQKEIEEAAAHLIAIKNKIDTEKMGEPTFLMVLTGGQFAYQRQDGVWVVPIGCLRD
jgi:predicted AAA+ superfamily ATPase